MDIDDSVEKGEGTTSEESDVDSEMDLDDTVKIRNDTTGMIKTTMGRRVRRIFQISPTLFVVRPIPRP